MSEDLSIVQNLIYEIRGQKVMLDADLARLYGIETRELKQAVRRNIKRFPADFMLELDIEEYNAMIACSRSQIVTLDKKGRGSNVKYKPFAFTELGVAMLSSVLKSETAIQANIGIMRAFSQVSCVPRWTCWPCSKRRTSVPSMTSRRMSGKILTTCTLPSANCLPE